MNFKDQTYLFYRSCFKGEASNESLEFNASKIKPVINKWVAETSREKRVADLGCGAGELLMAFKQLGFSNLCGCDLSSEQIAVAKKYFPDVAEKNLFEFLTDLPDNSLDIITAFDVLEHLGPQATFDLFREMRRVLVKGGRFIAHLPNGLSPFVGQVFWGDMTHEWCLTPASAKTLCLLHGFSNFEASEHLGASDSLQGRSRKLSWWFVRRFLNLLNVIETGKRETIWTRNFAFTCLKP